VYHSRENEENLARWVRAEWEKDETMQSSARYEAMISIIAEDGIGVIAGISMALADMKVSILQINTQVNKNGDMTINIVVECKNVAHYESIVSRLRSAPKVLSVSRGFSS
jgi:(p)ppGpp synthase/HD superfamily hydrolase